MFDLDSINNKPIELRAHHLKVLYLVRGHLSKEDFLMYIKRQRYVFPDGSSYGEKLYDYLQKISKNESSRLISLTEGVPDEICKCCPKYSNFFCDNVIYDLEAYGEEELELIKGGDIGVKRHLFRQGIDTSEPNTLKNLLDAMEDYMRSDVEELYVVRYTNL